MRYGEKTYIHYDREHDYCILLVLGRKWMAMGEWDDSTSDYGSFPHSLLSTSKL